MCPNLHDPQIQDELCLTTIRQWTGAHSWVLPRGSPVGWSGPVCCGGHHCRAALEATPVGNWGREEAKELNTKANTFLKKIQNHSYFSSCGSFVCVAVQLNSVMLNLTGNCSASLFVGVRRKQHQQEKKTYLEEGRVWVKLKSEKVHPRQQSRSDNRLRAARSPPRAAGKRSTLSVPVPSVPLWGPGFKETIKPCPLTSTPRVYCAVSFPSIDGRDKVALVLHRQKDREKQLCSKLLSAFTFPK